MVVEDDCQIRIGAAVLLIVRRGEGVEFLRRVPGEVKNYIWAITLIATSVRFLDVCTTHHWYLRHNKDTFLVSGLCVYVPARQQDCIERKYATRSLQRRFRSGKTVDAEECLTNIEPGGLLNQVPNSGGIVCAGQLDQNLIIPQAVFLDRWLAHAQRIDSVANGIDGLGHGAALHVSERRS